MSDEQRELVFLSTGDEPQPLDETALRERAASTLERGLAFVDAHGDALAQLRARVALEAEPQSAWVAAISALQADDGSFQPWPAFTTGLIARELGALGVANEESATLEALALLAEARALRAPCVEGAVAYLSGRQASDGGWLPDAGGDAREYVTTMIASLLGRTRVVRPEVLSRAGDFVGVCWAPERVEGGRFASLLAYSQFFTNVAHDDADAALQWCGRELEKGYRQRSIEALGVVRALLGCEALAMPGSQLEPIELLVALLDEQAEDGGFDALSPDGRAGRVAPTIDALRGVIALCSAF